LKYYVHRIKSVIFPCTIYNVRIQLVALSINNYSYSALYKYFLPFATLLVSF